MKKWGNIPDYKVFKLKHTKLNTDLVTFLRASKFYQEEKVDYNNILEPDSLFYASDPEIEIKILEKYI